MSNQAPEVGKNPTIATGCTVYVRKGCPGIPDRQGFHLYRSSDRAYGCRVGHRVMGRLRKIGERPGEECPFMLGT